MTMGIDPAGQDQPAGGVYLLIAGRQFRGQSHNATITDADICPEFIRCSGDGAVADHQIRFLRHRTLPYPYIVCGSQVTIPGNQIRSSTNRTIMIT